jgi:hypothetical protein
MNFDSPFPLVMMFLFFVFPGLLKRVKKKASRTKPAAGGFFKKIREQIQARVQLPAGAWAKKQVRPSLWEILTPDQDENQDTEPASPGPDLGLDGTEPIVREPEDLEPDILQSDAVPTAAEPVPGELVNPALGSARLSSRQLCRAVVWAEILDKPLALR